MIRFKYFLVALIAFSALLLHTPLVLGEDQSEGTQFDISGFLKGGRISQTANDDFFLVGTLPPESIMVPSLGSNLKFRTDLQMIPNDQLKMGLRISYQDNSIIDLPQNERFLLSRGFIEFSPGSSFSLHLGKQRLDWGTGYAWNPTNLLDLPRGPFTASDDLDGIKAVWADVKMGFVIGQLVVAPGVDWENSGKAIRLSTSPDEANFHLGWVELKKGDLAANPHVTTFDFDYKMNGLGLHGEAAYYSKENPLRDNDNILNYLLGIDYSFKGGFFIGLEYYHNDAAFNKAPEAQTFVFISIIADPTRFDALGYLTNLADNGGITRDHYSLHCIKTFGGNINTELLLVYTAADASYIAQPKFEYTWMKTTTLYLKGLVFQGDVDSEANLFNITSRWELGLRVNF